MAKREKTEAPKAKRPKRNYINTETREIDHPEFGKVKASFSVAHYGDESVDFVGATRETDARAWLDARIAEGKAEKKSANPDRILAKLDKIQAIVNRIGKQTVGGQVILTVAEFVDLDRALGMFRGWLGEGE